MLRCLFIHPWNDESVSANAKFSGTKKSFFQPNPLRLIANTWVYKRLGTGRLSHSLHPPRHWQIVGNIFLLGWNKISQYRLYALFYLLLQETLFFLVKRRLIWRSENQRECGYGILTLKHPVETMTQPAH